MVAHLLCRKEKRWNATQLQKYCEEAVSAEMTGATSRVSDVEHAPFAGSASETLQTSNLDSDNYILDISSGAQQQQD